MTSEPIVLTGYFSQSIGGGSHLCPKNFLFEPALEPGLSPQSLDELKARNIRLIYYTTGARECRPTEWQDTPPFIRLYGFDEPIDGPLCRESVTECCGPTGQSSRVQRHVTTRLEVLVGRTPHARTRLAYSQSTIGKLRRSPLASCPPDTMDTACRSREAWLLCP